MSKNGKSEEQSFKVDDDMMSDAHEGSSDSSSVSGNENEGSFAEGINTD